MIKKREIYSKIYNDYLREREFLVEFKFKSYQAYERTLIMLSSGFLAFSVSFLAILTKRFGDVSISLEPSEVLIWSWVFFASCITFLLIEFLTNAAALWKQVEEQKCEMRKEIAKYEKSGVEYDRERKKQKKINIVKKRLQTTSNWLIISAGVVFFIGMITLIRFSYINLEQLVKISPTEKVIQTDMNLPLEEK